MRRVTRRGWLNVVGVGLLALAAACGPLAPGQGTVATVAPTEAPTEVPTELPPATATEAATSTPEPTVTPIGVTTNTPVPGELEVDWTSTSPDDRWTATAANANLF